METEEPVCLIVIGMAGSGKSTFMQQLFTQIINNKSIEKSSFTINLDPGVMYLPYSPQIDIRKTINYKELMTTHGLGPNGAIMTALNLYSAKFNEVIEEIESNKKETSFFCVDTPGQIEVFTWSASGTIITNALAYSMPTVLVYIVDSVRCKNPNTFMSNMLFCCSIFYKCKLPIIVVFNKCDVENSDTLATWLKDYDKFLEAVHKDESYLSVLSRSLCLSLDEFYKDLNYVSVSSLNGVGFNDFFQKVEKAKQEYKTVFQPDMFRKKEMQKKKIDEMKLKEDLKKFEGDLKNLDINKSKEENKIGKNFFDTQKGKKIDIEFQTTENISKKTSKFQQKNEVIVEDVIEEEKI